MTPRLPVLALILVLHPQPASAAAETAPGQQPRSPGIEYATALMPGVDYDPAVTDPDRLLGFPVGSRMATPEEIERCLKTWEGQSRRASVFEYARSWEGRPLFYVVVTSEANRARLDEIRKGYAALADPEGLDSREAERLTGSLPAVAWLAYSIHGDETSGSDAALALLYHLMASRDASASRLLDEVVVIVDPMMNPDGRARWARQVAEHRGAMPSVDDQSLLHAGYWPWGRMNHYLFDLNRDWILGVQPETRGRILAAGSWHPLLFVDAHEMGSQDTYLFSPARSPRNPHVPPFQDRWNEKFAADQAAAFDRAGWTYYMGEWNEGWYPGYSDSWASFRGAVGILYEQASVSEDAVRRPHGGLLTYRESVHHQLTSSLANLETLRANAREILGEFLAHRREAVSASGPYAGRTFAILPTGNRGRLEEFLDRMHLQGIRVYEAVESFTAGSAVDQAGRLSSRVTLPAGTVLVPNRQPEANLVAAMLEFDTRMSPDYLARERKELLESGRSTIYDVTAWNLTMMYGLEALTLEAALPSGARRILPPERPHAAGVEGPARSGLWIFDGADDRSVAVAARLMQAGLEVRVADRPIALEGRKHARGSVVIIASENLGAGVSRERLESEVRLAASTSGLAAAGAVSGLGEGDLPDIGGRHFRLLEPPRIAVLARGGVSGYDFGAIWHMLDRRIGVPHTHLDEGASGGPDLRRYNLVVAPDRWSGRLPGALLGDLRKWVEAGGTLVVIGDAAEAFTGKDSEHSAVRALPAVLGDLDRFERQVQREWMAALSLFPPEATIWSRVVAPQRDADWTLPPAAARPSTEALEARDGWLKIFMPKGAFIAGRADQEHWLTFGTAPELPLLIADIPVLMAAEGVEAPVRLGVLAPAETTAVEPKSSSADDEDEPVQRVGWAALPEGHALRLRMSGLLWPEAAERIANSAWVAREARGSGQVILFASPPLFRGATLATGRILANALVYGPGLGASHPIRP